MEATSVTECVLQFRVGEKQQTNAYGYLAKLGQDFQNNHETAEALQMFVESCRVGEDKYMEEYCYDHWVQPDGSIVENVAGATIPSNSVYCKDKKGRWNKRKFLPNAYTSAKSVISNAIKLQIPIGGKGKSALQNAIKKAKTKPVTATAQMTSDLQACETSIELMQGFYKCLNKEDKEKILEQLKAFINNEIANGVST